VGSEHSVVAWEFAMWWWKSMGLSVEASVVDSVAVAAVAEELRSLLE
jgi:hypothetical protein